MHQANPLLEIPLAILISTMFGGGVFTYRATPTLANPCSLGVLGAGGVR